MFFLRPINNFAFEDFDREIARIRYKPNLEMKIYL